MRVIFGFLLAALSLAGAYHIAFAEGGLPLRITAVAMFVVLALFGILGIAFGRKVLLFGKLFVLLFIGLFVVRILFGP